MSQGSRVSSRWFALLLAGWWAGGASWALGYGAGGQLDVPYVPSTVEVVENMIQMAQVGERDMVFDLGCGDGRLVIAAAKRGATAVGVDLDPDRISESRLNAAEAGVEKRVTFLQQDLFKTDLHPATVVTLYLLPSVNLQLRPKLLRELKPGTRVVSHNYHMEEWSPDEVRRLDNHVIYFWTVPANLRGVWESRIGQHPWTLRLTQKFQQASGTAESRGIKLPLRNVVVKGDRIAFNLEVPEEGRWVIEGRLRGDRLEGRSGLEGSASSDWSAARDPKTAVSWEEAEE